MDKLTLRQDVLDELEYEPSIDAAHIGVSAEDGVVTLNGYVETFAQKVAAVDAARRVKGVRGVADEIEIRYPGGKRTADDEIAKRAIDVLKWDTSVPAEAVQVTVRNGWVTLTGQVSWQYQRLAAEGDVRKLPGVVGIANNISIRPVAQVLDVRAKIEAALRRRAELEAIGIRVSVADGGKVTLEGDVANWKEREVVETAAWSAPGVTSLDDRLRITYT
jgi:osmotically-inducible protein OsmY